MTRRSKPVVFPPVLLERMGDFFWEPDDAEIAVNIEQRRQRNFTAKMNRFLARYAEEELEYYRKRCAQIQALVAADKAWIERQNEIEAEMKRVRDYYEGEPKKEEQAADKARCEKCLKLRKEINRDMVRAELEELIRRGVYRGRRCATTYRPLAPSHLPETLFRRIMPSKGTCYACQVIISARSQ